MLSTASLVANFEQYDIIECAFHWGDRLVAMASD